MHAEITHRGRERGDLVLALGLSCSVPLRGGQIEPGPGGRMRNDLEKPLLPGSR